MVLAAEGREVGRAVRAAVRERHDVIDL